MTDPLDALRAPVTPADPDPAFAARLRARLERALGLPEGVAVTETTLTLAEREPPAPAEDRGAAIPYLAVRGARDALDWYARVLGARPRGEPVIMPDGRVGHAELELARGVIYLADEHPETRVTAPDGRCPGEPGPHVADGRRRRGGGGRRGAPSTGGPTRPTATVATVTDPYGHRSRCRHSSSRGGRRAAPPRQGTSATRRCGCPIGAPPRSTVRCSAWVRARARPARGRQPGWRQRRDSGSTRLCRRCFAPTSWTTSRRRWRGSAPLRPGRAAGAAAVRADRRLRGHRRRAVRAAPAARRCARCCGTAAPARPPGDGSGLRDLRCLTRPGRLSSTARCWAGGRVPDGRPAGRSRAPRR